MAICVKVNKFFGGKCILKQLTNGRTKKKILKGRGPNCSGTGGVTNPSQNHAKGSFRNKQVISQTINLQKENAQGIFN